MKGTRNTAPPGGIGNLFFNKIQNHIENDLIAQIDIKNGYKQSYKELFSKSIKLGLYLQDAGIQPGDVVLLCSLNNLHNMHFFVTCQLIGAVSTSLIPTLGQDDMEYLLELVQPSIIFVADDNCASKMRSALKTIGKDSIPIVAFHEHASIDSFSEVTSKYTDEDVRAFKPTFVDNLDATAGILFTSGSTGKPKAPCFSHNYIFSMLTNGIMPPKPGQITFGYSSLYWNTAVYFITIGIYYGLVKLSGEQFDAASTWKIVNDYKVDLCYLSYAQCIDALPYLNQPMPLKSLSVLGGKMPDNVYESYSQKLKDAEILVAYGSTEAGLASIGRRGMKTGSVGKLLENGQIIRVVDPDSGNVLNPNEVGELRIKAKYQMTEYYKYSGEEIWDADGFYKTGDLGHIDDDCTLFVIGRTTDTYKHRGILHYAIKSGKYSAQTFGHPACNSYSRIAR